MENNEELEVQPEENEQDDSAQGDGAEDTTDWKAEALKYKAIADRKEKKLHEENNKPKESNNKAYERLELKVDGYSKEEIDVIMENGGISALDNPLVKKGLEAMREEAKNKAKYLEASGGGPSVRKEKDSADLSEEERADLFHKAVNG